MQTFINQSLSSLELISVCTLNTNVCHLFVPDRVCSRLGLKYLANGPMQSNWGQPIMIYQFFHKMSIMNYFSNNIIGYMFQKDAKDPTQGFTKSLLQLNQGDPKYEDRQLTKQQEDKIALFESLGVYILVLGSQSARGAVAPSFCFMVSILMAFTMSAQGSQANFNPALTLAFCLRNSQRYQKSLLWLYFKSQVCGAFLAYVTLQLLDRIEVQPLYPNVHSTSEYLSIILSEAVGVAVIALTYLQLTGVNTTYVTGWVEKFTLMGIFAWIGYRMCPGSGFASNASMSFARACFGVFFCNFQGLKYFVLWAIGDILGVLIAVTLYNDLLEPHIVSKRQNLKRQNEREQDEQGVEMLNIVS